MNRLGVIDQIITSIIVLFVAFFLSVIFVTISSGVAKVAGIEGGDAPLASKVADADSGVLTDLFLSDYVVVDAGKISVKDALIALAQGIGDDNYKSAIINVFDEKYSCGGKNGFIYGRIYERKISKEDIGTFQEEVIRNVKNEDDMKISSISIQLNEGDYGFYNRDIATLTNGDAYRLSIKGEAC